MHTELTRAMEAWMASQIDTALPTSHAVTVTQRFARWQNHWLGRFAEIATDAPDFMCPCGHKAWAKGSCPKCSTLTRPTDESVQSFRPFAGVLGHLWAANLPEGLIDPVNLTELVYLVDGLKIWGDWGYNPPLTYTEQVVHEIPWMTSKVIHTTSKQSWEVTAHGTVYYRLTTTTGIPVAAATVINGHFQVDNIYPENTIGRSDRWDWLETWVTTFQKGDRAVAVNQWMNRETLAKCQWGESHPNLAALAKDFLDERK